MNISDALPHVPDQRDIQFGKISVSETYGKSNEMGCGVPRNALEGVFAPRGHIITIKTESLRENLVSVGLYVGIFEEGVPKYRVASSGELGYLLIFGERNI